MDYTSNTPLFICYLRSYLARGASGNLRNLYRGVSCADYVSDTSLLFNSLQVLLLLAKKKDELELGADSSFLDNQAAVVISYCLTLMDGAWVAANPYGIEVESFDHCGAPVVVRRVRSANNRLLSANEKYIASAPQ